MTMYLGETIRIVAVPRDPDTGDPLDPLPSRAWVDLWAPGVDRTTQVPTLAKLEMSADDVGQRLVLDVDTVGQQWRAGVWMYRVTAADTYTTIEYGTLKVEA